MLLVVGSTKGRSHLRAQAINIPRENTGRQRIPAGIKTKKLGRFSSREVLYNCLTAGEPYIAYGMFHFQLDKTGFTQSFQMTVSLLTGDAQFLTYGSS